MLTINKVRKSDAGRYRCEAVNSIGHVYREMNLIVNCKYSHVAKIVLFAIKVDFIACLIRAFVIFFLEMYNTVNSRIFMIILFL